MSTQSRSSPSLPMRRATNSMLTSYTVHGPSSLANRYTATWRTDCAPELMNSLSQTTAGRRPRAGLAAGSGR